MVPDLKLPTLRLDDLPHTATIERLAHLKGLDIAGLLEHTPAHIWVDRHIEVAHQHLASARGGPRDSRDFEVALAREANGAALQTNFTTHSFRHENLRVS
jgi:hypothetical protein